MNVVDLPELIDCEAKILKCSHCEKGFKIQEALMSICCVYMTGNNYILNDRSSDYFCDS